MGVDALERAFDEGGAFLPYLAAGDPGGTAPDDITIDEACERTARYVEALVAGGADVIELGLPFSEPIADGPTIQAATVRALDAGMTPRRYLQLVEELAVDIPIVAMTYYNPIFRYGDTPGVEAFVTAAADAGIDGLIVPDLPVEESDALAAACAAADVALVYIAAPTTDDDRLAAILERGTGYVYVQARLGTTGTSTSVSDHTSRTLERIRRFERTSDRPPLPKAVGFGISTGEQAATVVEAGADGIIVGSALVELVANATDPVAELKRAATELKRGAQRGHERRVAGPERS